MWRAYLPHAEIWEADFDTLCVERHAESLRALNISAVTGDQSNTTTLSEWIEQTGGEFDVIVDDGGHTNMQQYNSFITLFVHALRPGGVYFLEDLLVSRSWVDGDSKHVMADVIRDWINDIILAEGFVLPKVGFEYEPKFLLPPGLESIECFIGACVFTKCKAMDEHCKGKYVDEALLTYKDSGTALLTGGR